MVWVILLTIAIILLQIFLSKNENKWLGLILPFLSFVISILPIITFLISATSGGNLEHIDINTSELTLGSFVSNIPTLILLGIYLFCRNQIKKNKELEKMSIKDL